MNRLLQHFVDSNATPSASASRPPSPMPPQSSGGSYHGGNHGSYQRAAPGGPFYYQPPHAQLHWQSPSGSGLEEIPLTSQSSGDTYETVDLNTDTSRQQPQLFPPNRRSSVQSPGSRKSAAELFSRGSLPVQELFDNGKNPYRRSSMSLTNVSSVYGHGRNNMTSSPFRASGEKSFGHFSSQKDPFATRSDNSGTETYTSVIKDPFATQNGQDDPFSAAHKEENRNVFGNGTLGVKDNVTDSFPAQSSKEAKDPHDELRQQESSSFTADPFATAHSDSSLFESPALMNDGHEYIPSADSLFGSPAPINNGDWTPPAPFAQPSQPEPDFVQAQELFPSEKPSASSLFGAGASTTFQGRHPTSTASQIKASSLPPKPPVRVSLSPAKPQVDRLPSPAKSQTNLSLPPMKPPVGTLPLPVNNASSLPMRSQVVSSAFSVVRPEDHLTPALDSTKVSIPAKSPLKPGLDVRHMKFPAGKHEDDAMSNAPSIALSRMSMRSTLDDSLKLSDMYKQMTARLEGEKHDLLKVVAGQAQEIAHMKKHIKSLELQLKKYQAQDV